jgi:hypothetical protein
LSKRDFVACVGLAGETLCAGSGVSFDVDDDELMETDDSDPTCLEKLGFGELAECGITSAEFAKRNVLANNRTSRPSPATPA